MYGHDWKRGQMIQGAHTLTAFRGFVTVSETFMWICRKCGIRVAASDSAGLPGHEPNLSGRHLTCDEAMVEGVHGS